jgi:hypothetical protein
MRQAWIFLALVLAAAPARAALDATETDWDGSEPPPGVYFHWYEPSFYTGFAPRTQDPERVHIELARGNQVRVTVVLGDRDLDRAIGRIEGDHFEQLAAAQAVPFANAGFLHIHERSLRDHVALSSRADQVELRQTA